MAFSFKNHVLFASSVSFDDFFKEEASWYDNFISTSRREFHVAVDRYFRSFNVLSNQQLQEKRDEASIFFLLRLFNL